MDIENIITTLKTLTNARIVKSDIARALNVDPAALRRKELAKVQLKPSELKKIEDYFGVSLNKTSENTLERRFDSNIISKLNDCYSRILQIQQKNNLSQRQMAGILDISEVDFQNITSGTLLPDLSLLNNLKQNFKVSVDWVLYGE